MLFFNYVSLKHASSPVIIGSMTTYPHCGLSRGMQVAKKHKSVSPGLSRKTQKLDVVVDGKLPDDLYSVSIFSKVIGQKLLGGSRNDLYLRCRMNLANDPVQSQAPHFMDMGLLATNTLNESGVLGTNANRT